MPLGKDWANQGCLIWSKLHWGGVMLISSSTERIIQEKNKLLGIVNLATRRSSGFELQWEISNADMLEYSKDEDN